MSFAWKKFKFFFGYFFILLFDVALPNRHAATLNVGFISILCRFYVLLKQNIKTTSKRCIKKDVYMSKCVKKQLIYEKKYPFIFSENILKISTYAILNSYMLQLQIWFYHGYKMHLKVILQKISE